MVEMLVFFFAQLLPIFLMIYMQMTSVSYMLYLVAFFFVLTDNRIESPHSNPRYAPNHQSCARNNASNT